MKTPAKILLIAFWLCLVMTVTIYPNQSNAQTVKAQITFNTFRDQLAPFGRWTDYPRYGSVWVCNEPGFQPYYSNGYWAYTEYGWTWVSNYPWGWAPFHYGRWAFEDRLGWFWVPGYEWGPAWVSWRTGTDYFGWAPIGPGIDISVGFGFANRIPYNRWVFVPHRYINSQNLNHYFINRSQNSSIINKTTVINNVNVYKNQRYVSGPSPKEVEKFVGRPITPVKIVNATKPEQTRVEANSLRIYKPEATASAQKSSSGNQALKRPNLNQPDNAAGKSTYKGEPATSAPTNNNGNTNNLPQPEKKLLNGKRNNDAQTLRRPAQNGAEQNRQADPEYNNAGKQKRMNQPDNRRNQRTYKPEKENNRPEKQ